MILKRYFALTLGVFLAFAALSSIYAGEIPSLVVHNSERNGDWIKIDVSLASKADFRAIFKPKEVVLKLLDGSELRDWFWFSFFSEASANLNKGDSIEKIGEDISGKLIALSHFVLNEGSDATIEIPLKSGIAQKAQLYFKAPGKTQAKTLSFGSINAQITPKI
jgi:hypothetical protein